MAHVTYQQLLDRYGKEMACSLLLSAEGTAKIDGGIASVDEGARLQLALDALDNKIIAA